MTEKTQRHDDRADRQDPLDVTRRTYLQTAPKVAASPGVLGGMALPLRSGWGGDDTITPLARSMPDEGVLHGSDDDPSWYIRYEEGTKDSLTEWVAPEVQNGRQIVREHDGLNAMTVRAPYDDVGISVLFGWTQPTSGLREQSYVELIDRNIRMSYPSPIRRLADKHDWEWDLSNREYLTLVLNGQSRPSPDGVAFNSDVEESTPAQQQAALGADEVDVDTSTLTIGVVDTGADADSIFEDSTGTSRIQGASTNYITDETVEADGLEAVADGDGHGNWCLGCVAARTTESNYEGYFPDADLVVMKALDDSGQGSTADIVAAIEDAVDAGCDAVNLSLGSPVWSQAIDDALEYAVDQGCIPVVAAGNDRLGATWTASPADSEWAIAVTATTVAPPEERQVAYFANVGPDPGTTDNSGGDSAGARPDFGAPGMKTEALTPDGKRVLSGTSMAAPNELGVVGLLLASEGALSYEQVRDRLTTYHRPLPKVAVNEAEYGAADIRRAIDQTEPEEPQSDAMTDTAEARSTSYESISNANGGVLTN